MGGWRCVCKVQGSGDVTIGGPLKGSHMCGWGQWVGVWAWLVPWGPPCFVAVVAGPLLSGYLRRQRCVEFQGGGRDLKDTVRKQTDIALTEDPED